MSDAIKKLIDGVAYYSIDDAIAHAVKLAKALEIAVEALRESMAASETGDFIEVTCYDALAKIRAIAEGRADE